MTNIPRAGPRRVLVTGAGGFLGRWSVPALQARGYDVHVVRAPRVPGVAAPAMPAQLSGATLHYADLLGADDVETLVAAVRATDLLHFAWVSAPGIYRTSPENLRWVEASTHLARAFFASGGTRAVMAGSCAEYDWTQATVCREEATPLADAAGAPPSLYASSKLTMERRLAHLARQAGASTAWGRIFFQFGPGEHVSRLVPTVVRSLLAGRIAECTLGTQVRSFLHATDVGEAFAALLDSAVEGPVNVGSGEPRAVAALIGDIATQLGRTDLVRLGARPLPAGEPALLVPDISRLRGEVGWQPRFAFDSALADTIAWWRTQP